MNNPNDAYFDGLARAYVALYEGRRTLGPLKSHPGGGPSTFRGAFFYATQAVGSLESHFAASLPPVDESLPQSEAEAAVRAFGAAIAAISRLYRRGATPEEVAAVVDARNRLVKATGR